MDRRSLLAAAGLVLAGCSSRTEEETTEPTDVDGVLIRVVNATDAELSVTLTVTRGGATRVERSVTLAPDERTYVDPAIDETGDYELAVGTDGGREKSRPFVVDDYDLRTGANLVVEITDEDILILQME